jgi:hypothetical protein
MYDWNILSNAVISLYIYLFYILHLFIYFCVKKKTLTDNIYRKLRIIFRVISSRLFMRLSRVEVRLKFYKVSGGESRILIYPCL